MTASVEGLRIVAFGGGTGMAALLAGLNHYTPRITAVVTVSDNGGSSGILRNDYDMVAPGDIRNCLIALADLHPLIAKAFQYRFEEGDFEGHCFGNVFITVITRIIGDFEASIRALNHLLNVRGRVIPAAGAKVSLVAHHPDGSKSTGEVEISRSRKPIDRIELRPGPVTISEEIREAVRSADLLLFGPGSLFTSVIPNLLLDGLMTEIRANGSPTVYIGNLMTQPGETDGFRLADHIRALRRHVGGGFPDYVIAQQGELPEDVLRKYRAEGASPVVADLQGHAEFSGIGVLAEDFYRGGTTARHDSTVLAQAIHDHFLAPIAQGRLPLAGSVPPGASPGSQGVTANSGSRPGPIPETIGDNVVESAASWRQDRGFGAQREEVGASDAGGSTDPARRGKRARSQRRKPRSEGGGPRRDPAPKGPASDRGANSEAPGADQVRSAPPRGEASRRGPQANIQ